ncbi:asparagine synthase-related protein [Aliiruegeria lutimaris]|nr:asparagine synthase-related protein [Aliiruegeria lutimaris]
MRRRGPEGEGRLTDGPVALGHRLLATTPEAVNEPMPLRDTQTGCCITADARLDNREELFTAFGLNGSERQIGDGELILRAWEKWGEDCPCHLLGDFAFLIWDPRRQQLFGARDHMGVRQLIYAHRPGKRLVCATSANAVVTAPCIESRLNELRIAEALVGFEHSSLSSTFFEDVFRLPPGHTLSASGQRFSICEFWRMEPVEQLRLDSNEAYAEAFMEVFRTATRARLRKAGGIGSMMSGGIDSGETTAIAAHQLAQSGEGPLCLR